MPKNKKGGKKFKRKKKNFTPTNREMIYADPSQGQVYGIVEKISGGRFTQVRCSDDKTRCGLIKGRHRKKLWFKIGNIVLCTVYGTTKDTKCEIDMRYTPSEIDILKSNKLIDFDGDNDDTPSGGAGTIVFSNATQEEVVNHDVKIIASDFVETSKPNDFGFTFDFDNI